MTWNTSDAGIATVGQGENGGLVLGTGAGRVRLTASLGNVSANVDLEVLAVQLVSLEVQPYPIDVAVGEVTRARATGRFNDGSTLDVTEQALWQSVNGLVASVSNAAGRRGEVTGLGAGQTRISATLEGIADIVDVGVTAPALERLEVAPTTLDLAVGEDAPLEATAFYRDGTNRDVTLQVTWDSSDVDVATVSNDGGDRGLVTGVGVGAAIVTATLDGVESEPAEVTVSAPILRSLTIQQVAPRVLIGQTAQLTALGTYSDGSTLDVTAPALWTSSDERVATVSNRADTKGLVSAVAVGSTDVRVSYQNQLSPPVSVTVLPIPNNAPAVRLSCPETGRVGESIDFSGAGTADPDGQVVAYFYDFGDGRAPIDNGLEADASYTYLAAGQYTVTLTAEDDEGDRGSARCNVAVISADAPRVRFISPVGVRQTTHGETINFLVDARPGIGRRITRVSFTLDGEEVATDDSAPFEGAWQVPMDTANNAALRLQARATDNTNEVGVSDAVTLNVVNAAPVATFLAIPVGVNRIDVDASGVTDDTTPANGLEVRWDWENDGIFDTNFDVAKRGTHNYAEAGNYTVRMEVRDNIGQVTSAVRNVSFADQRLVNGDIGNDVWFGQVIVTGDVRVLPNTTLTIAAGTQVLFVQTDQDNNGFGDYGLLVNGRLLVQGEAENPVVFTSFTADSNEARQNGDWDGITLQGSQPSDLAHVVIEYAGFGLTVRDASVVSNTTVQQCRSHGISINATGPRFTDVTVQGCDNGVHLTGGANAAFTRLTSLRNRGSGVHNVSHTNLGITASSLRENGALGLFAQTATGSVTNSTITQNTTHGLDLLDSNFTLSTLTVTRNRETGLTFRGNSGGSLRQSNVTENAREGVNVRTYLGRNPTTVINRNNLYGNSTTGGYRYEHVATGISVTEVSSGQTEVSAAYNAPAGAVILEALVTFSQNAGGQGGGALLNGANNALLANLGAGSQSIFVNNLTSLKVQATRNCCENATTTLTSVLIRRAAQAGIELSVATSAGTINARENHFGTYPLVLGPVTFGRPADVDVQGFVGVPFDDAWATGPYYAGTLPAGTRWSGNVYVSGDVTVGAGQTLVIDPGTRVWVSPMDQDANGLGDYVLTATGAIDANGTLADPILVAPDDPSPAAGDYEGFVLNGVGSVLEYVQVRYAETGYRVGADATISDGRVQNSRSDGVRVTGGRATLRRMLIATNGAAGVSVTGAATVEDSYLNENGTFGFITSSATASSISFSEINGNVSNGIEVAAPRNLTVTSSTITFNGGVGVFVYSLGASDPTLSVTLSNLFGNANADGRQNGTTTALAPGFPVSATDIGSGGPAATSAVVAVPANTEVWQFNYTFSQNAGGQGNFEVRNGAGGGAIVSAAAARPATWYSVPFGSRVTSLVAYADRSCCENATTTINQVRTRQFGARQVEMSVAEFSARNRPIIAQNNYWGQFPVVLGDRIREGRANSVNFDGFQIQAYNAVGPR